VSSGVTVVIPVRNGERYVGAAIESALAQEPAPHDVIVVDDGSEDGSADVAGRFSPRAQVIRQEHAGIGAARNAGAEAVTTPFLAFLDSDDLLVPGSIAVRLGAFAADLGIDMVFGRMEQFGDEREVRAPRDATAGITAYISGAMLIRTEAFRRVGPFATDIRLGEFIDWYARAREAGLREQVVDAVVFRRRLHAANTSILEKDSRGDYARVLRAALRRRRQQGQP